MFSFDRLILELADKADIDVVLDEIKNCPDQVIYFSYVLCPLDS